MKLVLFVIFSSLLVQFTWTSNLVSDNDVESRRGNYVPLPSGDEDDSVLLPENRPWTVSRGQYNVGIPIFGTILAFMTSWGQNGTTYIFVRAITVISFLVCAQVYFGFYISVHRRGGSCCLISCLPQFKYNRIVFESNEGDVSFGRWAAGPFTWINEIISYLPPDAYAFLEEKAYFPNRSIVHLIFVVQVLYFFGLYDFYRSNILKGQQ